MFSLLYWAMDDTEGKPFDLNKFILRFLIFGLGMGLTQLITWQVDKNISKKKVNQNNSKK